jgi:hypothetical protein
MRTFPLRWVLFPLHHLLTVAFIFTFTFDFIFTFYIRFSLAAMLIEGKRLSRPP